MRAEKSASHREAGTKKQSETVLNTKTVSLERAARLFHLLHWLADETRTRKFLLQKLKIDIRTYYRDLELLREYDIQIDLQRRKYVLLTPIKLAKDRLPFPDPGLTLGEAEILAKGKSRVHKNLRNLLLRITKP